MKRVIITGKNGYIANNLKRWIEGKNDGISAVLLDMRSPSWKEFEFAPEDVIVHAAALVHKDEGETAYSKYEAVNVKLTEELASCVKKVGCKYFLFISTEAVYGIRPSCFKATEITGQTPLKPYTKYGITKLAAEEVLTGLEDDDFKVGIVRSPFVYGPDCPGNYKTLRKLTLRVKICPKLKNKKSMIYIDNLCEFMYKLINDEKKGIFTPQNKTFITTCEIAREIARSNGIRIFESGLLNPFVVIASLAVGKIATAFSNEYYSEDISSFELDYNVVDAKESVSLCEKRK